MPSPELLLASLAIRSCFVDTFSGFKAPSVFLKSDSVQRCPASLDRVRPSGVPRRRQYYQSTKTSCAEYGVAYGFASPPQSRLLVRSLAAGDLRRAWPRSSPAPPAVLIGRTQDLPGSWRIHPIPLPRSRTPAGLTEPHLIAQRSAVPDFRTMKTPAIAVFRDSITRLQYPLPTLQVVRYRTLMQGSLPAGG